MTTQRSGVSLIETIVAMAIVVLLAVAFLPNLVASADRDAGVEDAASVLQEIMDAVTMARFDNQDWAGEVTQLAYPITTSQQNACGEFYNPGRVNNWDGPYLDMVVPESGMPIGIGVLRNQIGRLVLYGGGRGQVSELKLVVDGVDPDVALDMSRLVDGHDDPGIDTIRWYPAGDGTVTLEWVRTVKGC
jgi:type II secretory pathway pseudopilin PulG